MIGFYYLFSAFFLAYYLFLILYISRGLKQPVFCDGQYHPSVTVIVPCHNEEKNLPGLLECLAKQRYPEEKLQIIFINDRSNDQTESILKAFTETHTHTEYIKILKTPPGQAPKKHAITRGIDKAQGEIIITTDADTLPQPNWIYSIISFYTKDVGMVLGYAPYRTDGAFNNLFHQCLALEYYGLAVIAAASSGIGIPSTSNGANLSYRKRVFEKINGFGEMIKWLSGDDDLLMHRMKKLSPLKIVYALVPQAAVYTNPPYSFGHFIRQRIRFSSKHLAYPVRLLVFLFGIYFFFVFLLLQFIGMFFVPALIIPFLIQLILKSAGELYLLYKPLKWMESRPLLKYYPLVMLPHILYVVIFPILGQIMKPRWK